MSLWSFLIVLVFAVDVQGQQPGNVVASEYTTSSQ